MSKNDPIRPLMSIGPLSQATGVPANTIRTWERRYGFPVAERTAGGHRVYPASVVPHIALVQRALGRGHRPGQVMHLSVENLRELLGLRLVQEEAVDHDQPLIDRLVSAALRLDASYLEQTFAAEFSRRGALDFLEQTAMPFLVAVGEAWEAGELDVYHEHFVSERMGTFLANRWKAAAGSGERGPIVLAALPGEDHVLGLHMVATVLAQSGWDPVFLGANTPLQDIVACVRQIDGDHVGISISIHADPVAVRGALVSLLESLPAGSILVCGGAGAPDIDGLTIMRSLTELERWAMGR